MTHEFQKRNVTNLKFILCLEMMAFKPKPCPISPTTITNDPNTQNEHGRELLGQIFFVKVMCDG